MADFRIKNKLDNAFVVINCCDQCVFRSNDHCTKVENRKIKITEEQQFDQLPAWCPLPKIL